jgi:hypothetical protein
VNRWTFALLAAILWVAASASAPGRQASPPASPPATHAVVVELFTSQGCSSCPPADKVLSELGEAGAGLVIPLSFHVDIWNHAGWTDPFSNRIWTERQAAYARAFKLSSLYTPQAVVDGAAELVGSDANGLRAAIASAEAKPSAAVALRLQPEASKVLLYAEVDLPESLRGRSWELLLAVFETGLVTPVGRGENGGRTLQNDYVVRSLSSAGRVDKPSRLKASLRLEKSWERTHLGVVAFLQDPRSLEIRGAAARLLTRGGEPAASGGP